MVSVTINEKGLDEIKRFLSTYHCLGADNLTLAQMEDWAYEATQAYDERGEAVIELKAWDCVLGCPKELVLDESGLDFSD